MKRVATHFGVSVSRRRPAGQNGQSPETTYSVVKHPLAGVLYRYGPSSEQSLLSNLPRDLFEAARQMSRTWSTPPSDSLRPALFGSLGRYRGRVNVGSAYRLFFDVVPLRASRMKGLVVSTRQVRLTLTIRTYTAGVWKRTALTEKYPQSYESMANINAGGFVIRYDALRASTGADEKLTTSILRREF